MFGLIKDMAEIEMEKTFGNQLSHKISLKESHANIAKFASDFRKAYAANTNKILDFILELLSQKQEHEISQEQLKKIAVWCQVGLPSCKLQSPLCFQIDTNRVNARGNEKHMNMLENWDKQGLISLLHSDTVRSELKAGYARGLAKLDGNLFTLSFSEDVNDPRKKSIGDIMYPTGAQNNNQKNDIEIVFQSLKYGRILVTNDGDSKAQPTGILGHAKELKNLGIRVMRDNEAVELVLSAIRERDEYALRFSHETGLSLLAF